MKKMKKIGIICGGYSSEYEISIKSATTILNNFPKEFLAYLIIVTKENWTLKNGESSFEFNPWSFSYFNSNENIKLDAALIYIHGTPGENGKIQALLDIIQIPYINSNALSSELSFDKWFCNQFLNNFGVNVAKSIHLTSNQKIEKNNIINELGLPCFVKPSDSGSSFGISKVSDHNSLVPALEKAFKEGDSVVIEAFLKGIEVTCGVYSTKNGIHTLPITEIVSENDFFDYDAKYNGKSDEIIPARISSKEAKLIEETAIKCYQLLQLKSIARIDFMLVDGIPFVIEVNTTPGFSEASIVPRMLKHKGESIQDFWKSIIEFELPDLL
jgi:D-alanine-D-alanine ligase